MYLLSQDYDQECLSFPQCKLAMPHCVALSFNMIETAGLVKNNYNMLICMHIKFFPHPIQAFKLDIVKHLCTEYAFKIVMLF